MRRQIVELMRVPSEQYDLQWLKDSLQAAIELELSTLPPYLCGMWSIKDSSSSAYTNIKDVILEEMLHMGLACNMLTAIGGTPEINSARVVPTYPGPLPGGVRPQLTVELAGLSKDTVYNIYMQIEYPEDGPVALDTSTTYETIGAFYDAISTAFQQLQPTISTSKQFDYTITTIQNGPIKIPIEIFIIYKTDDAVRAINEIKEQGEGTSQSPDAVDFGGELAHYYRFGEIYYGKEFVQDPVSGKWGYTGAAVPFPDVYNMPPIPKGGYVNPPPAVAQLLSDFNTKFSTVLLHLQNAWNEGNTSEVDTAVEAMFSLGASAQQLMNISLPDGSGVYGPDFQWVSTSAPAQASTTPAANISFKANILPLFTAIDIQHMAGLGVHLDDYAYMSKPANAQSVYSQVSSKKMPPSKDGGPWSDDKIALFKQWMDGGYQP